MSDSISYSVLQARKKSTVQMHKLGN